MPELCEVEQYRRLAERTVGRTIVAVEAPDDRYLRRGLRVPALRSAIGGRTVTAARRHGKLLLLDVSGGAGSHVLGLRFGMTGRLIVDGDDVIGELVYGPKRDERRWDRFGVRFDHGALHVRDARRLGGVELDPDVTRLGPDVLASEPAVLAARLRAVQRPTKAALLDQAIVAGVGNLLADEILFRAGIAPERPLGTLADDDVQALAEQVHATVADLLARGGSHRGDLQDARRPGGRCPRDGTLLRRSTVGGRTSWWCPAHQR
ncbi:MAG: hypothetical protein KDB35_23470 [Acidimicrobiales bacterium]|nr:hypothetical protein [Acidimicrobiales bacterium]MCB1249766.1 hypothetical protein [Acidimicrobiales bacterium]